MLVDVSTPGLIAQKRAAIRDRRSFNKVSFTAASYTQRHDYIFVIVRGVAGDPNLRCGIRILELE